MKIVFDAGVAQITEATPELVEKIKEHCLKWIDKSVEYQNIFGSSRGGNLDPVKYVFDDSNNTFPSGLVPEVCGRLDNWGEQYEVSFSYKPFTARKDIPMPEWAWEHQKSIVANVLDYRRCVVQSPTASGKTSSIGMILEKFPNRKCLVLLHQIDLMVDLQERLEEYLNEEIGFVGDGKKNWQRITVGSSATLGRLNKAGECKYAKELADIEVLIFDECHHYANNTGLTISSACRNTSYRVGLSATTEMENGSGLILEGVIGPTTLVIPDTLMADLGVIHKPNVLFVPVPDPDLDLPAGNNKLRKPDRRLVVQKAIIENDYRNSLIADIVAFFIENQQNSQGSVLILVEDVLNSHADRIAGFLRERGIESDYIDGSSHSATRKRVLSSYKDGGLKVLLATRILNEGQDVPLIELVVNACGGSGQRGIVQKVGRALRTDKSGRKLRAVIIDCFDEEKHYLRSNSLSRMRHLNNRYPDCARKVTMEELYALLQTNA